MKGIYYKGFREDITGLRALAVLPVLLFHSHFPFFSGGFLGVDVFFVISGFLITGIIIKEIESNRFSFIDFYERRARRILPALFATITLVLVVSPIFMVPYDLKNLGQSIVASVLAANNVLLYLTSGYWSHSAEFKPLYHTWSLGVEEQYYFIFPILVFFGLFIYRKLSFIYFLLFLIMFASFIYSFSLKNLEYNFLMVFTRAWEFMFGGLLALYLLKNKIGSSGFLSLIGLALIGFSYTNPYFFSTNQAVVHLLPVIGATLIIAFSGGTYVGKLLSIDYLVFIGLISFSVYLLHQPLIAFLRLGSEEPPSYWVTTLVAFLSIPLGYILWKYVETPFRCKETIKNKTFYFILGIVTVLILTLGYLLHKTYGFQGLWPNYSYKGNPQVYVDAPRKFSIHNLTLDSTSSLDPSVLVIGDSFARDFINMLKENDVHNNFQILYDERGCSIPENEVEDLLKNKSLIVLANNWAQEYYSEEYYMGVKNCIKRFNQHNDDNFYVLGAKNFGWNNNFVKIFPSITSTAPMENILIFNERASQDFGNYIDLLSLLEDENGRVPLFTDKGLFITYDTNHLTKDGARYVGRILLESTVLKEFLKHSEN